MQHNKNNKLPSASSPASFAAASFFAASGLTALLLHLLKLADGWLLLGAAATIGLMASLLPLLLYRLLLDRAQDLHQRHASLSKSQHLLEQVFEQTEQAVFVLDRDLLILDCNPRAQELLDCPRARLLGRRLSEFAQQQGLMDNFLNDSSPQAMSEPYCFTASNGRMLRLNLTVSSIDPEHLLVLGYDISASQEAEHRIQHLAYHDTLTDLPNRTLLTDRVNRALKRSRRSRQIGALVFLDLDNFKRINDSLGHSIGDLLLQDLAARLRHSLREEDTVSRLGGDEFVILIEQLGTDYQLAEKQIHDIADKVRQLLARPYQLNGHELYVTGSIGYVTFPRDGETMETLLRHADLAMYRAKQAGRNTITRFENEMDELATHRMRVESEVRSALQQGELQLYFQPVLRIRDGRMLGAEALLRWIDAGSGQTTSPEMFLPQIEDSALMLEVTDWVLEEACRLQAQIAADNTLFNPDYLAINISNQQFNQPNFVERVTKVIRRTGANPARLLFEITETVIMKNHLEARTRMLALKRLGIRFAIDDFGTGYSSLSYLKQLPADTLKIDKEFIRDVDSDADDAAIVRTILGIADHMDLQVIAEGVENQQQLQFLRANNCANYQGFLARPPLPRQQFLEDLQHSQLLRLVD